MSTLSVNNVQDLGADAVVTNGVVNASALPAGSILQVVQVAKTDVFTTTSTSFVDVTGLTLSITPTSATSKILITASIAYGQGNGTGGSHFKATRNDTDIFVGDTAGSRVPNVFGGGGAGDGVSGYGPVRKTFSGTIIYLDSPATTSATTYKVKVRLPLAGTVFVNRSGFDTDTAEYGRSASTLTLMEVAG